MHLRLINGLLIATNFLILSSFVTPYSDVEWGFFGHRLINKMAVYCTPEPLNSFLLANLNFVESHAIDPDKRRYAVVEEGPRHYLDYEIWKSCDSFYSGIDRMDWLVKCAEVLYVKGGDTISLDSAKETRLLRQEAIDLLPYLWTGSEISFKDLGLDSFLTVNNLTDVVVRDTMSIHGVLPWAILATFYRLRRAFELKREDRILRLVADLGHYVGDAHVPLHTTKNYNGQLTNQKGIHSFWESRLPELFAQERYNFFVGQADYVDDVENYIWRIVNESHALVGQVLDKEQEISSDFPEAGQYVYEDRNSVVTFVASREYAEAFDRAMNGMVEDRMRDATKSLASLWWTAYVDAGQPRLSKVQQEPILLEENPHVPGEVGRGH